MRFSRRNRPLEDRAGKQGFAFLSRSRRGDRTRQKSHEEENNQ
ncbi:MAG TPA: hypothetical protein VIJ61_00575 [Thermoanaerobaculia bacterium]